MSAPSFSSFPTAFTSFPDLDPGPSKRPAQTPAVESTDEKKRKKKKKDRDQGMRKERKHRPDKDDRDSLERHSGSSRRHKEDRAYPGFDDERLKAQEDSSIRAERTFDSAAHEEQVLYFTDRKGDPLNVQYGGLYAGSVPRYYLVGGGKTILGLEHGWRVVHRGRKGVEVAVGGRRKMHSLTDSSARHLLHAAPTRRLLASSEDKYKYDEVEGFLRISSGRERKGDPSYRSITKLQHDTNSDEAETSEDEGEESSGDDSDTTPMTSLQATLKSLEEQLSADPTSVQTWLSLLSHTLSTVPITSKNAPRARSEITLSILQRALSVHPRNASSKALRLRYLKAGEETWHESKLRAEWEDALKVGGIEMWIEWLDWRIRRAEKGVEGIVEDAKRVLGAVCGDEIGMLRALWRVAVGFRDAGYVERANALFQAQAELTYRTHPDVVRQPFESQLDALEEFWESEAPRMGEAGSRGQGYWAATPMGDVTNLTSPRKTVSVSSTKRDPFQRWATSESLSDRAYQLPTRSFDEAAEADPYATILFSDIRPLLVDIRRPEAKDALRRIWLAFLGLHVPGFLATLTSSPQESTDDRWAYAHLASTARLASVLPSEANNAARRITADAQAGVLIGREREYSSAFGPVKCWSYGVLGPLEAVPGTRWTMWGPEDVADLDVDLVREIFAQCRTRDNADWDVLSLAFEGACNLKSPVAESKKLLASAQDSLPLWAAHARLRRLRGRLDDARKVYGTILSRPKSDSAAHRQLWWDWAEMEWLAGQPDSATEVILRSTGSQGTGGIAVLRAKRHLQEATTMPSSYWKEREYSIKLWALLELLTASADAALATLDVHLSALDLESTAHESLTVASLELLYVHGIVLRNPMPPALLRERAEHVIEQYPSNTIVLGMFLEAQKGQAIWGRVKTLFGEGAEVGMGDKDLSRRVAEVWLASWEKGRWEAEQERTRGGLSTAVQSERTRGSTALWRLYVQFEVKTGHLERAKKLLFRAVGECPLAKELYLLAFGPLRKAFSGRELNGWAETMAERGIRMRRGLDEMLEGWTEEGEDNKAGESDAEDEIEHNARELRRLMPY
ncbi:NRDE-2, necessary for RNA interference-domain-containing protein [Fomitopsis serialis]|uniref:NRDE-2, necessary for RNA interference-domain-containing protein n=1 Tax=Fomitopsis serialis TaxID=139415 RepID=UPI0020085562|nr:NRDE-2, necessary for RNA interference-domain-containing protein [Neoantrodia serialis]KAH9937158.1 NRDE-2, necessary for RNA interference-domain-containing protein [Neoantrodia serialis]